MKTTRLLMGFAVALACLPAFAGGPTQGPQQAPQQAPSKVGMNAPGAAVAMQPGVRRSYSYDPATVAPVAGRRSYSYQPAGAYTPAMGYGRAVTRRNDPIVFTRTESVKSAAFKSVQQYGD